MYVSETVGNCRWTNCIENKFKKKKNIGRNWNRPFSRIPFVGNWTSTMKLLNFFRFLTCNSIFSWCGKLIRHFRVKMNFSVSKLQNLKLHWLENRVLSRALNSSSFFYFVFFRFSSIESSYQRVSKKKREIVRFKPGYFKCRFFDSRRSCSGQTSVKVSSIVRKVK